MVNSVLAVSETGTQRRDEGKASYSGYGEEGFQRSFSQMLEQAVNETKKASIECHTTTYGPDRRLMMFHYQTREY